MNRTDGGAEGRPLLTLPILEQMRGIEGWLDDDEADLLIATASAAVRRTQGPGAVVEIGSYCGRSTLVLASVVKILCGSAGPRVFAIDPHQGHLQNPDDLAAEGQPTWDRFLANLAAAGLEDVVQPVCLTSQQVLWDRPIAYLYVDGWHDRASVEADFGHFERWLEPGGRVAFHDYGEVYPEVREVVDELIASGRYASVGLAGSLMVLRKVGGSPGRQAKNSGAIRERLFVVVCDGTYFPGLWALLNSIRAYHGHAIPVRVYGGEMSSDQWNRLAGHPLRVEIISVAELPWPAAGMWEAKQQVLAHCLGHARRVCLLDADLVLTSPLDDLFEQAGEGWIVSSSDGGEHVLGPEYRVYGPELPGTAHPYINTGLLCLDLERHWDLIGLWAFASPYGAYSPGGGFPLALPGHGDQGTFNAIAARLGKSSAFRVLPEGLWCDCTLGCRLRIDSRDSAGQLQVWNETEDAPQRLVHSSGPKWWTEEGATYFAQFGDKQGCFRHFAEDGTDAGGEGAHFSIPPMLGLPRILIGICSCRAHGERRAAIRQTWLSNLAPGISAIFFVGDGDPLEEEGVMVLPVPDDYASLSVKVGEFFRQALRLFSFDYLFKCDDDTYVRTGRMAALLRPGIDFVGSNTLSTDGYASGGAGYLMSRAMVEHLVREPVPSGEPEDVVFSQRARASGLRCESCDQLQGFGDVLPGPGNTFITGHWCNPAILDRIHAELTAAGMA